MALNRESQTGESGYHKVLDQIIHIFGKQVPDNITERMEVACYRIR